MVTIRAEETLSRAQFMAHVCVYNETQPNVAVKPKLISAVQFGLIVLILNSQLKNKSVVQTVTL